MKKFLVQTAYNKRLIVIAYVLLIFHALFIVAGTGYILLSAFLVFFWGVNLVAVILFYKQPTERDINIWLRN